MSASAQTVVEFEKDKAGAPPAGLQTVLSASGKPGVLYQVEGATFPDAGKIGLWTKADSVIRFDDLRIVTH